MCRHAVGHAQSIQPQTNYYSLSISIPVPPARPIAMQDEACCIARAMDRISLTGCRLFAGQQHHTGYTPALRAFINPIRVALNAPLVYLGITQIGMASAGRLAFVPLDALPNRLGPTRRLFAFMYHLSTDWLPLCPREGLEWTSNHSFSPPPPPAGETWSTPVFREMEPPLAIVSSSWWR
jgi:hypothetical protein